MITTLSSASLAIGHGLLDITGRSWRWGAENFLRSPLGSSGLLLAAGLTLMASTNALYLQDVRHPAPMFGASSGQIARQPEALAPVVVEPETVPQRPASEPAATAINQPQPAAETVPAAETRPTSSSIGNPDIAAMQAKLMELGFFDGTVDGYYGPKTADAIRAFEARAGLPRTGAATPQVIQAVRDAPLTTSSVEPPAPAPVSPPQESPVQVASIDADAAAPLIAQMQEEGAAQRVVADVLPEEEPAPTPELTAAAPLPAALDGDLVSDVQRGLARLGFLQGGVTGVADESTARAIRRFQIFYNYVPTGEVSQNLRQMLVNAGAYL